LNGADAHFILDLALQNVSGLEQAEKKPVGNASGFVDDHFVSRW
jgi:hypothetical protein